MPATNHPLPSDGRSSAEEPGFMRRLRDGLRRRWRRLMIEVASRTGRYDRLRKIDWTRMERLVFICSGNICRSPYAEAVAIGRGVKAISCGTSAIGGAPADSMAIETAQRFSVNLQAHRSVRFVDVDFSSADLLVVMDTGHLHLAQGVAEEVGAQMTLLGLWDNEQPAIIRDPFGMSAAEFDMCFRRINQCIDTLVRQSFEDNPGL